MTGKSRQAYWSLRQGHYVEAFGCTFGGWRLGDLAYLLLEHRRVFGSFPSLWRPRRFRDRILRIMVSDDGRSALRARITDKEFAKAFVLERTGRDLSAKTHAVLRSREDVRSFRFPANCVIKATHDSGGVQLRRDGSPVDIKTIDSWFSRNYYFVAREPNYRSLQPKVIVEELLTTLNSQDLPDFKFFCFRGVPAFIQVDVDRFVNHRRGYYSPNWRELDFDVNYDHPDEAIPEPSGLKEMLSIATTLSSGFSFLRVDFYQLNDRIVVGELTNFPEGGRLRFLPDAADYKAGSFLNDPTLDCELVFRLRARPCPLNPGNSRIG